MPKSSARRLSGGRRSPGRSRPMPIARPSRSTVSATALPSRTGVNTVRATSCWTRSGVSVAAVVDLLGVRRDHVLELVALVGVPHVGVHLLHELVLAVRRDHFAAAGLEALPAEHRSAT